ncbi:hypothetical protein BV25DRAFT_1921664, partial [Artomyces pyxidatus]
MPPRKSKRVAMALILDDDSTPTLTPAQKAAATRKANQIAKAASKAAEDGGDKPPTRQRSRKGAQGQEDATDDVRVRKRAASSAEPVDSKGAQKSKKAKSAGNARKATVRKTAAAKDDAMELDEEADDAFEIIMPKPTVKAPLRRARKARVNSEGEDDEDMGDDDDFNGDEDEDEDGDEPEYSDEGAEADEVFDDDALDAPAAMKTSKALARQFKEAMPKWLGPSLASRNDDANTTADARVRKRGTDQASGNNIRVEDDPSTCKINRAQASTRNSPGGLGKNQAAQRPPTRESLDEEEDMVEVVAATQSSGRQRRESGGQARATRESSDEIEEVDAPVKLQSGRSTRSADKKPDAGGHWTLSGGHSRGQEGVDGPATLDVELDRTVFCKVEEDEDRKPDIAKAGKKWSKWNVTVPAVPGGKMSMRAQSDEIQKVLGDVNSIEMPRFMLFESSFPLAIPKKRLLSDAVLRSAKKHGPEELVERVKTVSRTAEEPP